MPRTPVISLVTLGVRDLAESTRFYRALGFPLSSASVDGEVSFFRTGGSLLGLYGRDALAADAHVAVPGSSSGAFSLAMNLDSRAEVDAALAAALAAGASQLKAAEETEWGGYHGYVADPDGHAWEIAHNPFWPLGDNGVPVLPE